MECRDKARFGRSSDASYLTFSRHANYPTGIFGANGPNFIFSAETGFCGLSIFAILLKYRLGIEQTANCNSQLPSCDPCVAREPPEFT